MQFINEDNGVLALHQFFHDGLEALFELAAVFRSGNNQRKIKREDALVREERWNVAVGDALRQAFHDGGLAYARLANQHRIVLRAAAQNLYHALHFIFATHQGIERAFASRLREVAAEFREQRSFFRPRRCRFFTRSARQLLAQGREAQTALHQDFRAKALLFAKDAKQQMLRADVLVAQALGLFRSHVQDALAFRAQRHFHGRGNALANGDASFNLFANGFDGTLLAEETVGQGFVFAHQAEQQMLRLNVWAAILTGLVPCEKYDATRFLCIAFEHVSSLLPQGPRPQ